MSNEMMNTGSREVLPLAAYEVRLDTYVKQVQNGWLGIGQTLNDAKAAHVVPHGQWEQWATARTGMCIRDVQRVMKLAEELGKATTLSHLTMAQATQLMRLPADERESWAAEVDAASQSSRQLKKAIDEKLEAQRLQKLAERDKEQAEMERQQADLKKQQAMEKANELGMRVEALEKRLDYEINNVQVVEREVVPEDYEELKHRDAAAAARIREAEDFAVEQEQRVRELQAKLDAAGTQGARQDDAGAFISACSDFFGVVCRWQNMTDHELLSGRGQGDLSSMLTWVCLIEDWAGTMHGRLMSRSGAEVDGYVR